jgi:hypothetical protein
VIREATESDLAALGELAGEAVDSGWLRAGRVVVAESGGKVTAAARALPDGGVELVGGEGAALLRELAPFFRGHGVREARIAVESGAAPERRRGVSFGSIHVQTDDLPSVEQAVRQFVPRLAGRSQGSVVVPPRNGWVAVYDEVCDRDPAQLQRLARELSDRRGAVVLALGVEEGAVVRFVLLERGRVMDEYLSVQEYYGPLPPGDVVALGANPRLVARLTGADPERVRAAAKHGRTPEDLPPAPQLLDELAGAIGIEGGGHGYDEARRIPGAVLVEA